jgi:hypothetical protein
MKIAYFVSKKEVINFEKLINQEKIKNRKASKSNRFKGLIFSGERGSVTFILIPITMGVLNIFLKKSN